MWPHPLSHLLKKSLWKTFLCCDVYNSSYSKMDVTLNLLQSTCHVSTQYVLAFTKKNQLIDLVWDLSLKRKVICLWIRFSLRGILNIFYIIFYILLITYFSTRLCSFGHFLTTCKHSVAGAGLPWAVHVGVMLRGLVFFWRSLVLVLICASCF